MYHLSISRNHRSGVDHRPNRRLNKLYPALCHDVFVKHLECDFTVAEILPRVDEWVLSGTQAGHTKFAFPSPWTHARPHAIEEHIQELSSRRRIPVTVPRCRLFPQPAHTGLCTAWVVRQIDRGRFFPISHGVMAAVYCPADAWGVHLNTFRRGSMQNHSTLLLRLWRRLWSLRRRHRLARQYCGSAKTRQRRYRSRSER